MIDDIRNHNVITRGVVWYANWAIALPLVHSMLKIVKSTF